MKRKNCSELEKVNNRLRLRQANDTIQASNQAGDRVEDEKTSKRPGSKVVGLHIFHCKSCMAGVWEPYYGPLPD